jgi:hypothetical protein
MEEEKKDGIGMNVFIILNCRARENRASERERKKETDARKKAFPFDDYARKKKRETDFFFLLFLFFPLSHTSCTMVE